jgi:hypothetical protein
LRTIRKYSKIANDLQFVGWQDPKSLFLGILPHLGHFVTIVTTDLDKTSTAFLPLVYVSLPAKSILLL